MKPSFAALYIKNNLNDNIYSYMFQSRVHSLMETIATLRENKTYRRIDIREDTKYPCAYKTVYVFYPYG